MSGSTSSRGAALGGNARRMPAQASGMAPAAPERSFTKMVGLVALCPPYALIPALNQIHKSIRQRLNECLDLIPHAAIRGQAFLFGFGAGGQGGRIVEPDVHDLRLAGKQGTVLVGVAADGDHVIKLDPAKLVDVLRALLGDVHARLRHHPDRIRIQAVRFNPGGVGLDAAGFQPAGPALGHLAAAGVARAEEQNLDHPHCART